MRSKPVERISERDIPDFLRPLSGGILRTEREYPCGCTAGGPGDVPWYCPIHNELGDGPQQLPLPLVPVLPTDVKTREQIPLCTGCVDYFPLALAAVANCSLQANEQHNPGESMHWSRNKSTAHADKIMKHLTDRGTFDTDGIRHSTKLAWRALALLQVELEADGGLPGRASTFNSKET